MIYISEQDRTNVDRLAGQLLANLSEEDQVTAADLFRRHIIGPDSEDSKGRACVGTSQLPAEA